MTIDLGSWSGEAFSKGILWAMCGLMALVACIGLLAGRKDGQAQQELYKLWLVLRLPMGAGHEAIVRHVLAQLSKQERAWNLCIIVGSVLSGVGLLLFPINGNPYYAWLVILPSTCLCAWIAYVAVALRGVVFPPAVQSKRLARIKETRLTDYVNPWLIYLAPSLLLAALLLVLAASYFSPTVIQVGNQEIIGPLWMIVGAAVLAVVACNFVAKAVVARPQPALDLTQLAWDDALRARTILKLGQSAVIAALFALEMAIFAIFVDHGIFFSAAASLALPTFIISLSVLGLYYSSKRAQGYFVRKLWPSFYEVSIGRQGAPS